jgi:hypothetical protein
MEKEGVLEGRKCGDRKEEAHHWIINEMNFGICKKCGAQRQFVIQHWNWQTIRDRYGRASHAETR